jgi:hypothetical protein
MPFQRGVGPLPTKYNDEVAHKAHLMCAIYGATDAMLARMLGVTIRTIQLWKVKHPEFLEIVELGKTMANAQVANELYRNCFDRYVTVTEERIIKGVKHTTSKQIFVQGDKWAQVKWLSVRDPEHWSETSRAMEVNNTTNINVLNTAMENLSIDELKILKSITEKQKPQIEDVDTDE